MHPPRRHLAVIALAALLVTTPSFGAEVMHSEITEDDGRYRVRFDVRLNAPMESLQRYLVDYPNYEKYFESIQESHILARAPNGDVRLRLRMHGCVWFFCRTLTQVKDISPARDGTIMARMDGTLSSFREGTERWHIRRDGNKTQLQYEAELVPQFFVPPLIGPWMLKRQLNRLLLSGAVKLETLAQRGARRS